MKEPNLASLLKRDFPERVYTAIPIDAGPPASTKLDAVIETAERPVLLSLQNGRVGALDANEFVGREIPVRLLGDGVKLRDIADACVYMGPAYRPPVGPESPAKQEAAYEAEKQRRRKLIEGR